ncbi:MAG: redoxin domain-containing protein [Gemmataceae bacterium]
MRRPVLLTAALLLSLPVARAADSPAPPVPTDKLNKRVTFALPDAGGKVWASEAPSDRQATVVVFLSFDCPISTSYSPQLADLHRVYRDRKVSFVGIVAGDELTPAQVAEKAKEFRLPFPVLKDDSFKVADLFQARTVPEAFVLDRHDVVRYRGRIDDTWSARLKKNRQQQTHDLKAALDAVLAGKPVATAATLAIGCPLHRERVAKKDGKVTYHRDVAPILQTHCQGCHRPGEVGPFSLTTYKQAVNWAHDIKEYTRDRKMPPWKVVEGVGFHNERRLTDRELATLAGWVDDGTPEGDPADAPKPATFTDGWQLGQPDLVLTVPEEVTVGPTGKDLFRCFVLPTGLTEDKFVVAVEVRPGNKRIVHHSLNFFDTSGQARELDVKEKQRAKKADEADRGPGYPVSMGIGFTPRPGTFGGLGGWAPGQRARYLPDGYGYPLPKGADVVMQIHYHRNGREEADRTRIGLYFGKRPGLKPYKAAVIRGNFLVIPPRVDNYRVGGAIELLEDGELRSIMPHMHMLGRSIAVRLTPPGGEPSTLLKISDWDYNWQETYFLKQPIPFKKGTRVSVEATYDNSEGNPSNPFHPPAWVRFGEQTDNEMCFVFLGVTNDATPGRFPSRRIDAPKAAKPPEPTRTP